MAINTGLAVAGAAIYVKLGLAGIIFAFLALIGFTYQAHLVARARHRSEQYVALSFGVLAGLMRSLHIRDERAARHAAAVARFAQDMAQAVGMDAQQRELAHTAGLLHDIGHFALSDRVAERGRALTEEDWVAIQRHPELGADMLKDLGMYGPVAEIVLSHHERIDGRGYPRGLEADAIPEIAKIIAVAEVYDTLTASDTYRTRVSSFEALRELRRVAGTQLDGRYVEALAVLLSGEGVEYRHADKADFDSELDMERRIREAGARA
jgi:putative nucleotidyltransferase with HDIG domain